MRNSTRDEGGPFEVDGADPSSGISVGDVLRLPTRHPAYRRREAQSGSRRDVRTYTAMLRKRHKGYSRKAESTDAPARGALPRSSYEAG